MRLTCGLRSLAGIAWAVLLMVCCLAGPCGRAWAVGATENVVVVVVDGARYTETFGDPTHKYISHIWYLLRPQGAIHTGLFNRGQTDTLGGHAAMLTGNHCWINWPEEGLSRPTTPTLFEYFRATTGAGESSTWLIANHLILLAGMMHSEHPSYGEAYTASGYLGPGSDYKLWQDVSAIMDEHQPRLMLLNLHATDAYGHQGLWHEYTRHLTVADRVVYEIWRKIQRHPFYAGRTTLIVTNDHGRHTYNFVNHGDWCEGCQHVMLLALGPDVRRGQAVGSPERGLHDIAATVGWLLDLPMPYGIDGEVMSELFSPELEVPPEEKAVVEGLELTAVSADSEGQPSSVFSPGDTVFVNATMRNLRDGQVRIYQGEVQTPRACVGKSYRETPVDLAAGETTTETFAVPIPAVTPAGDWPATVEFRGLDQDGTIIRGMTTLVITIDSGG
jgi:hypothetical protein